MAAQDAETGARRVEDHRIKRPPPRLRQSAEICDLGANIERESLGRFAEKLELGRRQVAGDDLGVWEAIGEVKRLPADACAGIEYPPPSGSDQVTDQLRADVLGRSKVLRETTEARRGRRLREEGRRPDRRATRPSRDPDAPPRGARAPAGRALESTAPAPS